MKEAGAEQCLSDDVFEMIGINWHALCELFVGLRKKMKCVVIHLEKIDE